MARMRRRRHRAITITRTNSISTWLAGWNWWMWASSRTWKSSLDSADSTTDCAERPWVRLLREEMARPSGVVGQWDLAPLARADLVLRSDDMWWLHFCWR